MNKKQKSTQLYPHPFSRSYWRDAALELKDTKILVIAALMIALRVALKGLAIPLAPNLKINIAFFVNAMGAMIFGPVVAAVSAAVSDTLGCLLFPQGVYFFPFIFIEIAGSVIFALFLYRAKVTATRLALSRFCIDFFVNILLNMPIMALYYKVVLGKSYTWMQLPVIAKNLCMFPVEAILLIAFMSVMVPLLYRQRLIYFSGEGLKMTKKLALGLTGLFAFMSVMVPLLYRQRLIYFSGEGLKMTKKLALGLTGLFLAAVTFTGGYLVYNYNTSNQASWLKAEEKSQINTALTQTAREQGLVEEDQICIISKVSKKLGQEQVELKFNVYDIGEQTDVTAAMGYRSTDAKKDETLTQAGSGSASGQRLR